MGRGIVFSVTHSKRPREDVYVQVQPDVYVSSTVQTVFDFPLKKGYYTVEPLDYTTDIVGESLDLAFLMASKGIQGVFSADVNPDFSLSPVIGQQEKEEALDRHSLEMTYAHFL